MVVSLEKYKNPDEPIIDKPKEIQPKIQKPIEQIAFNIPVLAEDAEVRPAILPTVEELDDIKNGALTVIGEKGDVDIVVLPIKSSIIVNNVGKIIEQYYIIFFIYVQVVAQFPSVFYAWRRYLEKP